MIEDELTRPDTAPYDLTVCPYNSQHKFSAAKYFSHIARCKDGLKVRHLYQTCQYNLMHILPLGAVLQHEALCPDARLMLEKKNAMKEVLINVDRHEN